MIFRWHDEGDGAGASTADTTSGNSTGSSQDAANSSGDQKTPSVDDLRSEIETLRTQLTEKDKALSNHGRKLGDLQKAHKQMKDDPAGFVQKFAKEHGINVKFDDGADAIATALSNEDQGAQAKQMAEAFQKMFGPQIAGLSAQQKVAFEHIMQSKHPDWDDLADERNNLQTMLSSGAMAPEQLFHFAAQGKNLPDALEAAKQEAVQEYIKELERKNQEQAGGGGSNTGQNAQGEEIDFDEVLAQRYKAS